MSDLLLELGKNPSARQMVKQLGLPIPMPVDLKRAKGPREDRPLAHQLIAVATSAESALAEPIALTLARAGANPLVAGEESALEVFAGPGEAFARPANDPVEHPGLLVVLRSWS